MNEPAKGGLISGPPIKVELPGCTFVIKGLALARMSQPMREQIAGMKPAPKDSPE